MADNPQVNPEELARAMAQLAKEREALDKSFGGFTSILNDSINESLKLINKNDKNL